MPRSEAKPRVPTHKARIADNIRTTKALGFADTPTLLAHAEEGEKAMPFVAAYELGNGPDARLFLDSNQCRQSEELRSRGELAIQHRPIDTAAISEETIDCAYAA